MEQNPVKKVCSLVHVVYFMLRKGICKRKLLLDLNMMIKRGKFSLFSKKHNSNNKHVEDIDMKAVNAAVLKAMEMVHNETVSPVLPGFGRSPVVRQLRVTDSPFLLNNVDGDSQVDEAAERFISRFYNHLRQQNSNVAFGSS